MNRPILLTLTFIIICLEISFASDSTDRNKQKFEYNLNKGNIFYTKVESKREILLDNKIFSTLEQEFREYLTVVEEMEETFIVKGMYTFYVFDERVNKYKIDNGRTYESRFVRKKTGETSLNRNDFYPNLVNVVQFPKEGISIGDSWENKGFYIIDLRQVGVKKPLIVDIDIYNFYEEDYNIDNEDCAKINVRFIVNYQSDKNIGENNRSKWSNDYGIYPARLIGNFEGNYFFSKKRGYVIKYNTSYNYIFFLENGSIQEIIGKDNAITNLVN